MNNISQFPGSPDYPELDVPAFKQAKAKASAATIEVKRLFIQTQYLPSLHSRVSELDNAMRNADSRLRETAQSLDTFLGMQVGTLRELQNEFQSAPESDKEEIIEDIVLRVKTIMDTVGKNELTLQDLIPAMASPIDRAATGKYITQLEADQARLPVEILEIKERQDALEARRKALTDAMAIVEAKGFTELAKDTALTAQELAKLGMAPPQLIAVEAAIGLALQVLERAENLINYLGMAEARDTLRKQIDDLINSTDAKNDELRLVTLKKELITECHNVEDQRAQFIAEFEKCVTAIRSFLTTHNDVKGGDKDAVAQFSVDALSLAKYLKVMA
ncbi:alpha-xenorhabdolysin family binary toxin subunit B [Pseudomonas huanghezhanensis]|uniref:alpha-xenorhabdolysin family binary toxin subunit B n=1 Tax=Pseudomonas huanghezhanensis TaxID=3002903 RepID=UPI0022868162|nr:alpha-xenorhabdolysin family binary toxin subunit B [Pseudomonas sp. BSw22131]